MSSTSPTDLSTPIKTHRWRVRFVRLVFVLAVLLTAVVAFYVVVKLRANAEWRAYQAEARARGVKLQLSEYVPPPLPDERNFAAIPLFQDAFKEPHLNPLKWPETGGAQQPSLGAIYQQEFVDLGQWQKFFVQTKLLPAAGDNPAADVLKALDHYAPQMEQLRLAGQRPEARFPVNYDAGIGAMLPHLGILQNAARTYSLRLAAHLALGDSPAAYEDSHGVFRLYLALEHEPTLIAGLVRLSMLAIVENAIAAGLQRHQWADAELAKIITDLGQVRLMDDYALGMGSERGFSNMLHDQLIAKGSSELAGLLAVVSSPSQSSLGALSLLYALYPSGWLRRSETRNNRYLDEMLARVTQDPPRIFPERAVPNRVVPEKRLLERLRYLLFYVIAPALDDVERNYGYGQTLLDETRLGCALERHRLAHGSFPASLDALTPAYIPALPRDVMNGEPLHYRTEAEGGYTLYSVGWNLQDDGGKFETKKAAKAQPDWVWSIR